MAAVMERNTNERALPPRQGPVMDGKAGAVRLENGVFLVGEDDAMLPKPEVYYHPQQPNLKFRLVPGQFPLPHFDRGRYTARTKHQEATVRRILGQNADRWRGDTPTIDEDMACEHTGCEFATRNIYAFNDHRKFFGH